MEDIEEDGVSVVASTLADLFEAGSGAEAGPATRTRSREVPPGPQARLFRCLACQLTPNQILIGMA